MARVTERSIGRRWTEALAKNGWTPVPDFFLDVYQRLDPPITNTEAMFIVHLIRHKWDSSPPFPAFRTIAKRMGISVTATRSHARNLERKKYLIREKQPGTTNRFHLGPLFNALEKLQKRDEAEAKLREATEILGESDDTI